MGPTMTGLTEPEVTTRTGTTTPEPELTDDADYRKPRLSRLLEPTDLSRLRMPVTTDERDYRDGNHPTMPVDVPMADPIPSIMPTNEALLGKSRLGGLSHNKISGSKFVRDLFRMATGQPIESLAAFGIHSRRVG